MNRHQAADDVVAAIDNVLAETIDGARDDWEVGPDAMRWSPEPIEHADTVEQPPLDAATLARLADCMNVAVRQVEDAWTQLTAAMFAVVTPQLTPRPAPPVYVSTTPRLAGYDATYSVLDESLGWACLDERPIERLDRLARDDTRELSAMRAAYAQRSRARRRRRR